MDGDGDGVCEALGPGADADDDAAAFNRIKTLQSHTLRGKAAAAAAASSGSKLSHA